MRSVPPKHNDFLEKLSDFELDWSIFKIVLISVVVGAISSVVALALLDLIGLVTNISYFGTTSITLVPPSLKHDGLLSILVPAIGGLVVGVMARYGSERIRGHGIPEAMETILVNQSNVEPKLAILKPLSSAISIGTGGPFGAEGPIIMTGGAFGSLIAQLFKLSAIERRALMVAGASAGMAAVFGTPVAATLLGVELLVLELRPRTMVPIALASATAGAFRNFFASQHLIKPSPLFPVPFHQLFSGLVDSQAVIVGVVCGLVAWALTHTVFGAEDLFKRLPIHWMWWPAIGGLLIGVGGQIDPRALGVGYNSIGASLAGHLALDTLVVLFVVKLAIFAVGLGSGTSAGVLAPTLLIGATFGGVLGSVLVGGTSSTWAILGMGAVMAGSMRIPFTAIVFCFELTHNINIMLPLLISCTVSHLISVLILKRSILTEKIARRSIHTVSEYGVDPLEALLAENVMDAHPVVFRSSMTLFELVTIANVDQKARVQRLFPVLDNDDSFVGTITRRTLENLTRHEIKGHEQGDIDGVRSTPLVELPSGDPTSILARDIMTTEVVTVEPHDTLNSVAELMAVEQVGVVPVVEPKDGSRLLGLKLLGLLNVYDLLTKTQSRKIKEERYKERVLNLLILPTQQDSAGK